MLLRCFHSTKINAILKIIPAGMTIEITTPYSTKLITMLSVALFVASMLTRKLANNTRIYSGEKASIAPTMVATPFPPRPLFQNGYKCPNVTAITANAIVGSENSRALPIMTTRKPFSASPTATIANAHFPSVLPAFRAPRLPLFSFCKLTFLVCQRSRRTELCLINNLL